MNHSKHLLGCGVAILAGVMLIAVGVPLGALAFLACPLMMIFMMKGMNQGGSSDERDDRSARSDR